MRKVAGFVRKVLCKHGMSRKLGAVRDLGEATRKEIEEFYCVNPMVLGPLK